MNAVQFVLELTGKRGLVDTDSTDYELGLRMKDVFQLSKKFMDMPLAEIEILLENPALEIRLGAVSIMDWKARDKKTNPSELQKLYTLYIKRHDRINHWAMVDRAAPYVVGKHLFDRDRKPLYKLAKSTNPWERRTAIVSTYYFIRQNDLIDTFKIANILVNDKEELVQKAVGSWTREAGKKDNTLLTDFLNTHASTMPRVMLRYAIEHQSKQTKEYYLQMRFN
ncbi:DNA alkylation repair protein [soil metagenome]